MNLQDVIGDLTSGSKRSGSRPVNERIVNVGFSVQQSKILRSIFKEDACNILKDFVLQALSGNLEKEFPGLQAFIVGEYTPEEQTQELED